MVQVYILICSLFYIQIAVVAKLNNHPSTAHGHHKIYDIDICIKLQYTSE